MVGLLALCLQSAHLIVDYNVCTEFPISCVSRLIHIYAVCQCPSLFWSLYIVYSLLFFSSAGIALHGMAWHGNDCIFFLMTPIYNVGDDFDNRRALDTKCTSSTTHFRTFQWFHGFGFCVCICATIFFMPPFRCLFRIMITKFLATFTHKIDAHTHTKILPFCASGIEKTMHTLTGRHEQKEYRLRNNIVVVFVSVSMDSGCVQWIFGLSAVPEKSDSLNH